MVNINNYIPDTAILILTGISCIGKTTIAYDLIRNHPQFRRITEVDIVRNVVRSTINILSENGFADSEKLLTEYSDLFKSITLNDYNTAINQSTQLMPYIKGIIERQQRRKIPTIIEGAGIILSTYFPSYKPLEWINKNIVFINLYLSSELEHLQRRRARYKERKYKYPEDEDRNIVKQSRNEKNDILNTEALLISERNANVFSIDVLNKTSIEMSDGITNILNNYYKTLYDNGTL